MRCVALLAALFVTLLTTSARADDPSPTPCASSTTATPPPATPDESLRAELARQGAAIRRLRAGVVARGREGRSACTRPCGYPASSRSTGWSTTRPRRTRSTAPPASRSTRTASPSGAVTCAPRRRGRGWSLGSIEIDANTTSGPQVRPIDAEVSLRWPEKKPDFRSVAVAAGDGRPDAHPVRLRGAGARLRALSFLERANMLQALFPGEFDLGAALQGQVPVPRRRDRRDGYGNPIGDKVFPDPRSRADQGPRGAAGRRGRDCAHGIRVQCRRLRRHGHGLSQWVRPATKNQLVWQDQNGDGLVESNEIVAIGGAPATPSQVFHRFAIGGDARIMLRLAPLGIDLTFRGEVIGRDEPRPRARGRRSDRRRPRPARGRLVGRGDAGADALGHDRRALRRVTIRTATPASSAPSAWSPSIAPTRPASRSWACSATSQQRLLLEYDVNKEPARPRRQRSADDPGRQRGSRYAGRWCSDARARSAFVLLFAGACSRASCSDGVQADRGTDAYFQVPGARRVLPRPHARRGRASGPAVEQARCS